MLSNGNTYIIFNVFLSFLGNNTNNKFTKPSFFLLPTK